MLAPRLTVSERALVLNDRRGWRIIDFARVKSVDWSVTGIDLELTSGERLSLQTFSPPSAFGLADRRVSRLVRAATFQAMALNQGVAERVKAAMRDARAPYRAPASVEA